MQELVGDGAACCCYRNHTRTITLKPVRSGTFNTILFLSSSTKRPEQSQQQLSASLVEDRTLAAAVAYSTAAFELKTLT